MVYHGVTVVWYLPVFPCLPFVSFLAFMPFLWQFLLASFPPSFLSVGPVCFFLSCFSSSCIYILSSFCFPPTSILFIRRFRFPVWFCVLERSQNEGMSWQSSAGVLSLHMAWHGCIVSSTVITRNILNISWNILKYLEIFLSLWRLTPKP